MWKTTAHEKRVPAWVDLGRNDATALPRSAGLSTMFRWGSLMQSKA
jgi:hypothetical protein